MHKDALDVRIALASGAPLRIRRPADRLAALGGRLLAATAGEAYVLGAKGAPLGDVIAVMERLAEQEDAIRFLGFDRWPPVLVLVPGDLT